MQLGLVKCQRVCVSNEITINISMQPGRVKMSANEESRACRNVSKSGI